MCYFTELIAKITIMTNIIKNIQHFILSVKERFLLHKLKNTTKNSYTNKNTKNVITKGASLTINSKTNQTIARVKENITAIVNKTDCNPSALIDYIKAANTPVFRLNNAGKILALIKEEEGLISEKEGFEALCLSIATGQGIKFKTLPMFVLSPETPDKYWMLHNFYRWYSMKADLPGFDIRTQALFKCYLLNPTDEFTKSLSMSDILSLQEAIARDSEATAYVLEYTNKIEGGKNVLDKIKTDGNATV